MDLPCAKLFAPGRRTAPATTAAAAAVWALRQQEPVPKYADLSALLNRSCNHGLAWHLYRRAEIWREESREFHNFCELLLATP